MVIKFGPVDTPFLGSYIITYDNLWQGFWFKMLTTLYMYAHIHQT
jgi:hypothetical protein